MARETIEFRIDRVGRVGPGSAVVGQLLQPAGSATGNGAVGPLFGGLRLVQMSQAGKTYRFSYSSITPRLVARGNLLDGASFEIDQDADGL